jgi:hypothetical protein
MKDIANLTDFLLPAVLCDANLPLAYLVTGLFILGIF